MSAQPLPGIRRATNPTPQQPRPATGPDCDPALCLPSTGGWLADCCHALSARYRLDLITCAGQMLSIGAMALLGRRGIGPYHDHIPAAFACIAISDHVGALRACRERLLAPIRQHQDTLDAELRQPAIEAQRQALVLESHRRRFTAIASGSKKDIAISPEEAEILLLDCLEQIDALTAIRHPHLLLHGHCDERHISCLLRSNQGRLGIILDTLPVWHPLLTAGLRGGAYDTQPTGPHQAEHFDDLQIAVSACCDRTAWQDHLAKRRSTDQTALHDQEVLLITGRTLDDQREVVAEDELIRLWDAPLTEILARTTAPETCLPLHLTPPPACTDSEDEGEVSPEEQRSRHIVSKLAMRIMLILSRIDRSHATIPGQAILEAGAAWQRLAMQHRQAALLGIGRDPHRERRAEKLVRWISEGRRSSFKRSEANRALRGRHDHVQDWQQAIDQLSQKGLVSCQAIKPPNGGHSDLNITLTPRGREELITTQHPCA